MYKYKKNKYKYKNNLIKMREGGKEGGGDRGKKDSFSLWLLLSLFNK